MSVTEWRLCPIDADGGTYIHRTRYDQAKAVDRYQKREAGDPSWVEIDDEFEEQWAVADDDAPVPRTFTWQTEKRPYVQPGQVGYPYLFNRIMYGPAPWLSKQ